MGLYWTVIQAYMHKFIELSNCAKDITGETFGQLTVIGPVGKTKRIKWLCVCECGTESVVRSDYLVSGHTKSCGCLPRGGARHESHGMRYTPEYSIWRSMRTRCDNKGCKEYSLYGGRGISVCKRWESFTNFYADMGPRPEGDCSLDRIDNSGDYTPENCRWATTRQQANNRRSNRFITFKGKTLTAAQWGRRTGISGSTICARISNGWDVSRALTEKPRHRFTTG